MFMGKVFCERALFSPTETARMESRISFLAGGWNENYYFRCWEGR